MTDLERLFADLRRDQKKLVVLMAIVGVILPGVLAGLPYAGVGENPGASEAALIVFAVFAVIVPALWLTSPTRGAAWKAVLAAPTTVTSATIVARNTRSGQHVTSAIDVTFRDGKRVRLLVPAAFDTRVVEVLGRAGGVASSG